MKALITEIRRRVQGVYYAAVKGWTYDDGWNDAEGFYWSEEEEAPSEETREEAAYEEAPEDDGWEKYGEEEVQAGIPNPVRRVRDAQDNAILLETMRVESEEDGEQDSVGIVIFADDEESMALVDPYTAYRYCLGVMSVADEILGVPPYRFAPSEVLVEWTPDDLERLVYGGEGAPDAAEGTD